jgi:ribonuclease HII
MKAQAGIDEVGRGCIAGPVVSACVFIEDRYATCHGITDSKKLSERKRDQLAQWICQHAKSWAVGVASVEEIDRINILQATFVSMQRAVHGLPEKPQRVWIDGRDTPDVGVPAQAVIGGDSKIAAIACASIVAKVFRDHIMAVYDRQYPGYGLSKHKGYGTAMHLAALRSLGVTPIHRKSFRPVSDLVCVEQ